MIKALNGSARVHIVNPDLERINSGRLSYLTPFQPNKLDSIPSYSDKQTLSLEQFSESGDYLQGGYTDYLAACWANHYVAVTSPDLIWQVILQGAAELIVANPEPYRQFFTRSKDKVKLTVPGHISQIEAFVADITNLLSANIVDQRVYDFFPDFSTTTPMIEMSRMVAFCQMASPYYDYGMLCCGIPAYDVRGTDKDWQQMVDSWNSVEEIMCQNSQSTSWFKSVQTVLSDCVQNLDDPNGDFWLNMFKMKHCGSGSDQMLSGWYTQLFVDDRSRPLLKNAPSGVCYFDFTDYGQVGDPEYRIYAGPISSVIVPGSQWDTLEPCWDWVMFKKGAKPDVQGDSIGKLEVVILPSQPVKKMPPIKIVEEVGFAIINDAAINKIKVT